MDAAPWASRTGPWDNAPTAPSRRRSPAGAYLASFSVYMPEAPVPRWKRLAGSVLRPSRPAPGFDGEPCGTCFVGACLVATRLGSTYYTARQGPDALDVAFRPSMELLVWIVNFAGSEFATDMRPRPVAALLAAAAWRARGGRGRAIRGVPAFGRASCGGRGQLRARRRLGFQAPGNCAAASASPPPSAPPSPRPAPLSWE